MKQYLKETLKYILRTKFFINAYLKEVEAFYQMSEEELFKRNEQKFLEIFRLAIDKSPFYKNFYEKANIQLQDIQSLNDIEKLPIIDKNIIGKDSKDLATKDSKKLRAEHTSGTTGTPRTIYRDFPSIWREQAYYYIYWKRRGFVYGKDRCISLRGNLDRNTKQLNIHASKTLFLSSYNINEKQILEYYNLIKDYKPVAIFGYPSSLYNLATFLKDKGLKLSIPKSFTSSETVTKQIRETIEEVLQTELYDYYGGAERTISLMECMDHRGYFSSPGYSINEFKEDSIITTSLINSSYPLIRYKVEDVITLVDKPIKKDLEISIVKSIDGRLDDYILAKDESKIAFLSDFLFEDARNVKLAQIIQTKKGKISINLVLNDYSLGFDKDKLIKIIDERVGLDNIEFEFHQITDSDIIYTTRNKFRQVISSVKNNIN